MKKMQEIIPKQETIIKYSRYDKKVSDFLYFVLCILFGYMIIALWFIPTWFLLCLGILSCLVSYTAGKFEEDSRIRITKTRYFLKDKN